MNTVHTCEFFVYGKNEKCGEPARFFEGNHHLCAEHYDLTADSWRGLALAFKQDREAAR